MKIENQVAVVTGGSNGMGRALCLELVSRGAHVATCDINMGDLAQTVKLCKEKNPIVKVSAHNVDVSNEDRMMEFAKEVVQEHGRVSMLFANAGIAADGTQIYDDSWTEEEITKHKKKFDKCFDVLYYGVLYSIRAFVPLIIKEKSGYVACTSSVNGMWTWPSHGCYTAAKHAVKGLTLSLQCEMEMKYPHIGVACIMPGGVRTSIIANTTKDMDMDPNTRKQVLDGFSKYVGSSAEEAADWIVGGVANDKTQILVGYDAWLIDKMVRIGPRVTYSMWKALGKEGFTAFGGKATKDQMIEQAKAISVFGWLRIAYASLYPTIMLAIPMQMVMLARDQPLIFRSIVLLLFSSILYRFLL